MSLLLMVSLVIYSSYNKSVGCFACVPICLNRNTVLSGLEDDLLEFPWFGFILVVVNPDQSNLSGIQTKTCQHISDYIRHIILVIVTVQQQSHWHRFALTNSFFFSLSLQVTDDICSLWWSLEFGQHGSQPESRSVPFFSFRPPQLCWDGFIVKLWVCLCVRASLNWHMFSWLCLFVAMSPCKRT